MKMSVIRYVLIFFTISIFSCAPVATQQTISQNSTSNNESRTSQDMSNSVKLKPGMSKSDVESILGKPVKIEFSGNLSAWHYCETGWTADDFVVVIFDEDNVVEERNYNVTLAETGGATGHCSKFVKAVDFNTVKRSAPKDQEQIMKKVGTAWLIDSGYVITNNHVISDCNHFYLVDRNKNEIPLNIVAQDRSNDIAILRAPTLIKNKGINVSKNKAGIGSNVFTVGFPHPDILGSSPKLSVGIINSQTGFLDDPRTYQISVPLQSGNSGGPLVDKYGNAIGIVTSKLDAFKVFMWTGDLPENINYAVKSTYLHLLLSDYSGLNFDKGQNNTERSVEELVNEIQSNVYQIIADKK